MKNMKLKSTVLASAVAAALLAAGSVQAAQGIKFDPTGTASYVYAAVKNFNWVNTSVMFQGTSNMPIDYQAFASSYVGTPLVFTDNALGYFYGQGQLDTGKDQYNNTTVQSPQSPHFTYQFKIPISMTWTTVVISGGVASQGAVITDPSTQAYGADNYFKIFYDASPSVSTVTGTGYGTSEANAGQMEILGGKVNLGATTFTVTSQSTLPISPTNTGTTTQGVTPIYTISGSGNAALNVEQCDNVNNVADAANPMCANGPTTLDTNFFLSDLDAFLFDITMTNGYTIPFQPNTDVPAQVVGQTPNFGAIVSGQLLNNGACEGGAPTSGNATNGSAFTGCDLLAQGSNAVLTFQGTFIPEPASLALLGLGLGLLGFSSRRRKMAV